MFQQSTTTQVAHQERLAKKSGDITSVFLSDDTPLPARFSDLKKQLWKDSLVESWRGVLEDLKVKTDEVAKRGSDVGV